MIRQVSYRKSRRGREHRHGPAPGTPMPHIAMHPGGATEWLERVSDADYERLCAAAS